MRPFFAALIFGAIILPGQEAERPRSAKAKAVMKEMGHGEGKLRPGDLAPDFNLRLSSFRNKKPVALIFGELHLRNSRRKFLSCWSACARRIPPMACKPHESAKTYEQKDSNATSCARTLGIEFATVVDGMDNAVEQAYTLNSAVPSSAIPSRDRQGAFPRAIPSRDRQGVLMGLRPTDGDENWIDG